jgi:signal transduction histidine kinase
MSKQLAVSNHLPSMSRRRAARVRRTAPRSSTLAPVVLAVALVAAGTVVSIALHPIVKRTSLVILLVAIAIAAWRGGWRAGVLSTVLSLVAAGSLIQSHALIGEAPLADIVLLGLLATGGGVLTWLVSTLQRARARADDLAAELRNASERAEAASRAKGDFLNTMSHELRTPLNAIAGYAELIATGVYGAVTEKQLDALKRIQNSQRYLLTLVNDVLTLAKLDARSVRFALESVAIERVVETAETMVLPQCELEQVRYERAGGVAGVCVRADPMKLNRVLVNLLGNACKFTPASGSVSLSWEADAERVRIHVADTGRGIDAAHLDQIFEPFVQAPSSGARGAPEGTGLGLAISRELARGMEGDLTVVSTPGKGSRFTIVLVRADVPCEAA